jgi:hypothetical protein
MGAVAVDIWPSPQPLNVLITSAAADAAARAHISIRST